MRPLLQRIRSYLAIAPGCPCCGESLVLIEEQTQDTNPYVALVARNWGCPQCDYTATYEHTYVTGPEVWDL